MVTQEDRAGRYNPVERGRTMEYILQVLYHDCRNSTFYCENENEAKQLYKELLSEDKYNAIEFIMFYKRDREIQDELIRECTFEPKPEPVFELPF